ncbi:MAG: hypothetical protein ACYC7E_08165, partial [Armatimonadota bacterium]
MISKRKRLANLRNAQKSTGPRTPQGKAKSSQNAIKHGFFARATLLPQEDRALFTDFARAMRHDLMPVGALEEVYAAQIIVGAWRMQRQARIEAGVFSEFLENARKAMDYNNEHHYDPNYPLVFDESEVGVWGHAFTFYNGKGEPFEKLIRYQTLVSREFHRAVHDLQRLQAARPPRTYDDWLQQQPDPDGDSDDPPTTNPTPTDSGDEKIQNEPISSFNLPPSAFQKAPPPGSGGGQGV